MKEDDSTCATGKNRGRILSLWECRQQAEEWGIKFLNIRHHNPRVVPYGCFFQEDNGKKVMAFNRNPYSKGKCTKRRTCVCSPEGKSPLSCRLFLQIAL